MDRLSHRRLPHTTRFQGLIRRSAAFTIVNGYTIRNIAPGAVNGFAVSTSINTPSETAITHVLMHESLWDMRPPVVTVHEQETELELLKDGFGLLPQNEQARYIGRGIRNCDTPNVPRQAEMIQYVLNRLDWDAESFNAFRLWVDYPTIGSRIRLAFKV